MFHEEWNVKKTGYPNYEAWLEDKLGKSKEEISPRVYEEMQEIPFKEGWHLDLALQPGFKEVLGWTKYNETFSRGNPEQIDWRAEYLNPKIGFDLRDYLLKRNSTFDYGETNIKTKEMLVDYLRKKYEEGYGTVVYTDDKIDSVESFRQAAEVVKKEHKDFSWRLYHILNDDQGLRQKEGHLAVGNLYDILKHEKKLRKTER